jgi:hypothetical protein
VTDVTNSLGQITNMSCIKSYTNDIPTDADFILCQIGANDSGGTWRVDMQNEVPDTSMDLTTFKGCFNQLLIGLKKNYPNAKIGIVLANTWSENLGQKSEDVLQSETSGSLRQMTQWQKVQCQKLNIPVFDPVEDTRMFGFHLVQYPATENDQVIPIENVDLSWYDRTKREIGTDNGRYIEKSKTYAFQTQYMNDGWHTSEIGNMMLSFFYENWMKTVLVAN